MDLWQLYIFCRVIEHKSFSKAGTAIHLSQPTISSHIKDLENHFGCRLIDRLTREAVPTHAGKLLYNYARKLLTLRDETEAALSEFQGNIRGRLTIGGSTIPGTYILPKVIGLFTKSYPDVLVSLKIGDTKQMENDILAGELEISVVGAKTDDNRLVQEKLVEDAMCLVIPADHKWAKKKMVPLKNILNEPFIMREAGSGTLTSIRNSLSKTGIAIEDFRTIAEMGTTQAVIQGIKNKVGISILSTIAVSDALEAGDLKALSIEGMNLKRCFFLTTPKHRSASPICRVFIGFIKDALGTEKKSAPGPVADITRPVGGN